MNPDSSGWQPVDPTGTSSAALPEAPPPGELLVFASAASDDDRAWAAATVAEIAREWADSVERLLVMDLDLQGPGIHDFFDAEPAEGATDVLLFGASISRVTQPVEGGSFHFAPSGTPVADPRVILSNARWERVLQGCREAGISLVVHLPLGQPGSESLLARADRIVRLGGPGAEDQGIASELLSIPSELEDRVVAALTPPGVGEEPVVDIAALAPDEPVVDIADLAPDEPVEDVEEVAGELGPEVAEGGAAEAREAVEAATEETAFEARREGPGPGPVVDIADLAPDGAAEDVEEVTGGFGQAMEDEVAESREAFEAATEEEAFEARREAPGPGPVVDIADLAPDEPVGIARAPEEGVGIPEEPIGVEDGPADFPEGPSPEAEVDEEVVPFGPESGEVEEVAPDSVAEGTEAGFGDDEFAAGLEAIDAAAANKPRGFEGFDLEGLDDLADPTGRRAEDEELGGEDADTWEGLDEGPGEELEEKPEEVAEPGGGDWASGLGDEPDLEPEGDDEAVGDLTAEPAGDLLGDGPDDLDGLETAEVEETMEAEQAGEPEEAMDFGGFSGELDLVDSEEAPTGAEPEAEDGDFAGMEEEPGADEVFAPGEGFAPDEDLASDEGFAPDEGFVPEDVEDLQDEVPSPASEGEAGGGDLADDLVTGPDFGQGAPEVEESWEDETAEDGGAGYPSAGASGAAAGAGASRGPDERARRSAEEASRRRREDGQGAGPPPARGREDAGEPVLVGTEAGEAGERSRSRGRPLRLLLLAAILAMGAVGAHWFGVVDVPGLDRVLASVLGPAGTGVAPTVDTSAPQPASPVQSQSLLIDVYRDAESAGDVALALQDRLPDRIFVVAPVQQDGDVIYRLLAGPANTPDQAADLRETLAGVLTREDPSGWTPEATSLAFLIDELPALDGARARARAATGNGVFGYVLQVEYPDDSTAYRVYAGGYSSPDEARALQGILSEAGIRGATFTERRGEVPE